MAHQPTPFDPYPFPLTQEMADLELQDYKIIDEKIRPLKKIPQYVRIGVPVFLGIVGLVFYLSGSLTWMFGIFALFGLGIIVLAEFAVRYFLDKLKKDLENKKKRIWNGTLTGSLHRQSNQSKNNRSRKMNGYIWQVSGKEFRVAQQDFKVASKGDQVQIEQLPESDLVLRVRKIT